nr:MAG TPA: hypothetical protein [Caudoviricetes sp.]
MIYFILHITMQPGKRSLPVLELNVQLFHHLRLAN